MNDSDRIPLNGTFELTARCNLSCKMCLVRLDDNAIKSSGRREITTGEWIELAKQVHKEGTFNLLLTGGEPLLRQDFCEIYEEIYRLGFLLTLYTNATLITPKVMKLFDKYPPHTIGITIYGSNPEVYEKVCGNGEAFHKMIEGINLLKTLPSQLEIRTTITKDNIDDYKEIKKLAHSLGEGIPFNRSRFVSKAPRGGIADVESCRLTPEDNIEFLYGDIIRLLKEKASGIKLNEQEAVQENKSLYGCNAGISSYTISWDGKLIACALLGNCWTDPINEGFKEAWRGYPDKVTIPPLDQSCNDCKFEMFCNACPATRFCETGDISGKPEYICREAEYSYMLYKEFIQLKG